MGSYSPAPVLTPAIEQQVPAAAAATAAVGCNFGKQTALLLLRLLLLPQSLCASAHLH